MTEDRVIDVLRQEAAAGFPHLAGACSTGTVRLSASALVALGLRQVLRHPAVTVEGREVTVDFGVLDRAGRYRRYWAVLQRVRLQTTSGQVHIAFDAAVA